jgi:hypothetical protein
MKILTALLFVVVLTATPAGPRPPDPEEPAPQEDPTAAIQEELEEFVPTEEVPADSAISFPVDI